MPRIREIPEYESNQQVQSTPMDPRLEGQQGQQMIDLGQGISAVGEHIQQLTNSSQTLKAEAQLTRQQQENIKIATMDPDLDNVETKIRDKNVKDVEQAASLIKNPHARNEFIEKSKLSTEVNNTSLMRTIYGRKSQEFKDNFTNANTIDITDYKATNDPRLQSLIRDKIVARSEEGIAKKQLNPEWARLHVETLLKQADIARVSDNVATDPAVALNELSKGKEGSYAFLTDTQRVKFMDQAEKTIKKNGADNNYIAEIAQNNADSQIIDLMGKNALTQEFVNNSAVVGINGIKPSEKVLRAATEALQDPFPMMSSSEKYVELFNMVADPNKDPIQVKTDVLRARGLTPEQKSRLINTVFRQDDSGEKATISQLINQGIQQNKQDILQANNNVQKEVKKRQGMMSKIGNMFGNTAKDDAHLADLQEEFVNALSKEKDMNNMLDVAKGVINKDNVRRNPSLVSNCPKNGSICIDANGNKARVYENGRIEEL